MSFKLITFLKFYLRFPLLSAIGLSFQFLFGNFTKVQLPNYKSAFCLRKNSSDLHTFVQVFLDDEYKIDFDKNAKIVIDAGANIGLFTIKIKNELPNATVICVEPDPENFELAKSNLANYDNVFLENAGLWDSNAMLKVYDKHNYGKWGIIVEEDLVNGNIAAVSVDALLEKYNISTIDILKIDIEGSEKQLFSRNYENWLCKVKVIVIELHDGNESGCSKTFFEAINKTFTNYSLDVSGENIVITNNDLK